MHPSLHLNETTEFPDKSVCQIMFNGVLLQWLRIEVDECMDVVIPGNLNAWEKQKLSDVINQCKVRHIAFF